MIKDQGRENTQAQTIAPNLETPKKNHFYSLYFMGEQGGSLNLVTVMLQVFSIDVYTLLDPGATLSFVTPW